MYSTSSKIAVVGALATFLSMPAVADELTRLGPVPPHEPILTSVGTKRVIAFYLPGSGQCALHAVIGDKMNINPDTDIPAVRVRISLEPGQTVHIDSVEGESLNLRCGGNAESLALVDTDEAVAFGIITQPHQQPINASVSGF
jgi:hypothetical protein